MANPLIPPRFTKDPRATLDYGFDWTLWLAGDTIASSTWTLSAGITEVGADTFTASQTAIWIGGGVTNRSYQATNSITTAANPSRTDQRSFFIDVAPFPARRFDKDPRATLDYGFDWTLWLAGDTIMTSTWTLSPGITEVGLDSFTATKTTIWIGGGVANRSYQATNAIMTAATPPRTDQRSLYFDCANL